MKQTIEIMEATRGDLPALLALYKQLHPSDPAPGGQALDGVAKTIFNNPAYNILLAKAEGEIAASVTVIVIPNLTRGARPYAVIENVITAAAYRRQGIAAALMDEAVSIAREAGCYKVSLTTGNKDEATFRFYERCGFNREDKTAFICWLEDV